MSTEPRAGEPRVSRDGGVLAFAGTLSRDAVPALWRAAQPLAAGATRIDLTAVDAIDSAGIAMLGALVAQAGNSADITGTPAGLTDLCAAYRLDPALGFAT